MKQLFLSLLLLASSAFGADTALTDRNTITKSAGVLSFQSGTVCLKGSSSGCTPINALAAAGSTPIIFPAGGTVATLAGTETFTNKTINASQLTGSVAAGTMPPFTGDVTTSAGAVATTLATVNGNVGTFGSATQASVITVNAKGLATAASNITVTPAIGSITGLGAGVATWLASASPIRCASGTLSGALTLGSVNTATASCTGARNTMAVACNYVADPGTIVAAPKCVVSSNDVVTVTQSGLGVVTPTSTTVQIVIMP